MQRSFNELCIVETGFCKMYLIDISMGYDF